MRTATQGRELEWARDGSSFPLLACRATEADLKWALLAGVASLYLPFIFAGPGSDPDSMRELHSGATLLWQHRYVLSRPPGYFPYEAWCGLLYALGGTVATNLATVAMSLLLLDSFVSVSERFEVPHRYLLTATMAIQPLYWTCSTSTIDFIWALGCFMAAFRLWLKHRYLSAAVLLGLAVGMRLSSVFLAGPFLIWEIFARPREAKLWMAAALATVIGAVLYLPEFVVSSYSFGFLSYYIGAWTLRDHVGRFIYKNVYFWGLLAALFFLAIAPLMIRELVRSDRRFLRIMVLSISTVVLFEGLFLKIPVQRAYLLPILPFALILLGIALRARPRMLLAMAILIFSYNFVNLNLAHPDVPDHATQATLGLFIEPGYLFDDLSARLAASHHANVPR